MAPEVGKTTLGHDLPDTFMRHDRVRQEVDALSIGVAARAAAEYAIREDQWVDAFGAYRKIRQEFADDEDIFDLNDPELKKWLYATIRHEYPGISGEDIDDMALAA